MPGPYCQRDPAAPLLHCAIRSGPPRRRRPSPRNHPAIYAVLALHRPPPRATIVREGERDARISIRGLGRACSTRAFAAASRRKNSYSLSVNRRHGAGRWQDVSLVQPQDRDGEGGCLVLPLQDSIPRALPRASGVRLPPVWVAPRSAQRSRADRTEASSFGAACRTSLAVTCLGSQRWPPTGARVCLAGYPGQLGGGRVR